MKSWLFNMNIVSGHDLILEQLEDRIVLDGAVDDVSHRAELFSAQITDSDFGPDAALVSHVADSEEAASLDVEPLALETGTEWLQDGTWHYWETNWDLSGDGYEFHSWQDGTHSFRTSQWDASGNGYDYLVARDGSWTYRVVSWDASGNGYLYDSISDGSYHYSARQWDSEGNGYSYDSASGGTWSYESKDWHNGLGFSYSSNSDSVWTYQVVQQVNEAGDVAFFSSNSSGWWDYTYRWANGESWHQSSGELESNPQNSVSPLFGVLEDNGANGSLKLGSVFTVNDADGDDLTITLTVGTGFDSLSFINYSGAGTVTHPGSEEDWTLRISGTQSEVNEALDTLVGQLEQDFNGTATINIDTSDGSTHANNDLILSIKAVNDAPVNSIPGATETDEDAALTLRNFAIQDVDSGWDNVTVTLTAEHGTLSFNGQSGPSLSMTNIVPNINTTLAAGVLFVPEGNYFGSGTVRIVTDDLGHNGGPALTDSDEVTISVLSVNDAPVNSLPIAQIVNMSSTLIFDSTHGNLIRINDVDAGNSPVELHLSVSHGTLTLSGVTGLTFTGGADGTNDMTIRGTLEQIGAALNGLAYRPFGGFSGNDALRISTNDLGNTGAGAALINTDDVQIQVNNPSAVMVKNICPDPVDPTTTYSSDAKGVAMLVPYLMDAEGKLFFSAHDGIHGQEPWTSDGTEAGTYMIKDLYPGLDSSMNPGWQDLEPFAAAMDNVIYFATHSYSELWCTDATEEGTFLVKDTSGGLVWGPPTWLHEFKGNLYFKGTDMPNGEELWRSDGTAEGTRILKNISPTYWSSWPFGFTEFNDQLYFYARAQSSAWVSNATQLYVTDGTPEGTTMFLDQGDMGGDMKVFNGALYFPGFDGVHGTELWKTDGTIEGTIMVKDIQTGYQDGFFGWSTEFKGELYFGADDGSGAGSQLWKTDGTEVGTVKVSSAKIGVNPLIVGQDLLFFTGFDWDHGWEWWCSDGTEEGTRLVKDVYPGLGSGGLGYAVYGDGALYFAGTDGDKGDAAHGVELWKTDGTEAGTVMVKDINPGPSGSHPMDLTYVNGTVFFIAADGVHGRELWRVA